MSIRKVFVHLHIPKCGGTTVGDFLKRNFKNSLLLTNGVLNDYQYSTEQNEKIIDHFPTVTCISGHKHSLKLPFERTDLDIVSFTWIRDPIDRFVSHYFFHRNHTTKVPEAKTLNLMEYTEWALQDGNQPMYINGQSKFLSGGEIDLDGIRNKVDRGRLLVFPLEEMQSSFYTLSNSFPSFFTDTRMKTKNISHKDQKLPVGFKELILPYVIEDLQLRKMAYDTNFNLNIPNKNVGEISRNLIYFRDDIFYHSSRFFHAIGKKFDDWL